MAYTPDTVDAVTPMPTIGAAGPNPGYWLGSGTVLDRDLMNSMIAEVTNAIINSPGTPALDKSSTTQLSEALDAYLAAAQSGQAGPFNLYQIEDQKTTGTNGGAGIVGWNTRDLNTEKLNNISGASLSTNQVTLPAGTYWVEFDAPADGTAVGNLHQSRFWNVTDGSEAVLGGSESAGGPDSESNVTRSFGEGEFTIASSKVFELRHYISQTSGPTALGKAASSGSAEVYSKLKIYKTA